VIDFPAQAAKLRIPTPATGVFPWLVFFIQLIAAIENESCFCGLHSYMMGLTTMKSTYGKLNRYNQNTNLSNHPQNGAGVIYKVTAGGYTVQQNGRTINCQLAPHLRKNSQNSSGRGKMERQRGHPERPRPSTGALVVGDVVRLEQSPGGPAFIHEVLPRRNQLSRRSAVPMPSAYAPEQVIAANVDQVVPVFAAANPTPKWNMLDRYLALAESLDLPALIVITKLDLAQDADGAISDELLEAAESYRRIGYPLLLTSAVTGQGLDEFRQALQPGLSVLLGKSGVGKTALLNALQPGLGLRVNEVSQSTGKGKHTTTHLEIFSLDSGGALVDTPGVREFGLWDMDQEELAYFYREMRPFIGRCRFGLGCAHVEEPGCAIRKAVTGGLISPQRYQRYLRLKEELSVS
jgi:ribosome biogenesis GTPase